MKDIKHIRLDFHSVPWVLPKGLGLGGAGVKSLIFSHSHVAYQIRGLIVAQDTLHYFPFNQTGDLGAGSRGQLPLISSKAWGFAMARHRMCSSVCFVVFYIIWFSSLHIYDY